MTPDQERLARQQADSAILRLWQALLPLSCVNSFLQTGAHPDDETSSLLARLSLGDGVRVGYACAVRGEGGQNDISTERGEALGVLRSREMEAAANVLDLDLYWLNEELDGPIVDFGLSKSAEETFSIWGHERTVERLVRVIRSFRPDAVAPTFLDVPGQHGHHRAITRATEEAFHLAADPDAFPEHADAGLAPWRTAKFYLPAWSGAGGAYDDTEPPPNASLTVPIGGFDAMRGASFAQIAQWSRARHRTQGMGRWVDEGDQAVPLHRLACTIEAPEVETTLFDGLPKTLSDLAEHAANAVVAAAMRTAQARIESAHAAFPDNGAVLAEVHAALGAVRQARAMLDDNVDDPLGIDHRLAVKERQLARASRCAALLIVRLTADRQALAAGDESELTLTAHLGGARPLQAVSLSLAVPAGWRVAPARESAATLMPGRTLTARFTLTVPADSADHHPYRFAHEALDGDEPPLGVVHYAVDGIEVAARVESEAPLPVLPAISVTARPSRIAYNMPRCGPIDIGVDARHHAAGAASVKITLGLPDGWRTEPTDAMLGLEGPGSGSAADFTVVPPAGLAAGRYVLPVELDGVPGRKVRVLRHRHVRPAHHVTPATVAVQAMAVDLPEGLRIGYVDGGVDRVHDWLRQLGAEVELLDANTLGSGDLTRYQTIVVGVFAYKTRPDLLAANRRLHNWVAAGGNLVTQYHRPWDNWNPETVPPHFLKIGQPSLRWRVTDQNARVTPLLPDHPLLNRPNAIGADDWQGWVKERGLYFAAEWAPDYTPLLSMADPGESPLTGSLLSAPFGRGRHTHTSLILYYQMEHLVPGAFRLMANLVTPPRNG